MPHIASTEHKEQLILRLRRVEGQLRGIQKMIESDADCDKVAQQLTASRKALDRCFYTMLACAVEQAVDEPSADENLRRRVEHVAGMLAKFA